MKKAIIAATLTCAACQAYTAIPPTTAVAGQSVRLTMRVPEGGPYGRLGSRVVSVDGHVARVTDSTLIVDVSALTRVGGTSEDWANEEVTFLQRDVATVEKRAPSVGKSLAFGIALVGGAVAARSAISGGESVGGRGGNTPVGAQ